MTEVIIIGSGIVGLSLAEYFSQSKNNNVSLISNENPRSGSLAAAANLATKGQYFARDAHFDFKLRAKKKYKNWLTALLQEASSPFLLQDIFRAGIGVDYFTSPEKCAEQFKRVKQPEAELKARGLPLDGVTKIDEKTIAYRDEMWVDASLLLSLLRTVLETRGCHFYTEEFSFARIGSILQKARPPRDSQDISLDARLTKIIFCAGAWTQQLLETLGIPTGEIFCKARRLTIGSTFVLPPQEKTTELLENNILCDFVKNTTKVTVSGNGTRQYLSSSTLKIEESKFSSLEKNCFSQENKDYLALKNADLFAALHTASAISTPFASVEQRTGVRIGYGHSELVCAKLPEKHLDAELYVCTGAHKSGFLFAPVLGDIFSGL